jgi:hypothetical protein
MADLFKPLHDLFFFVSELPSSIELRESQYVWSLFEVAHVVCMCLFAGLIIMMDLRLLGIGNMHTPSRNCRSASFPWQMLGMTLSAITRRSWSGDPMRSTPISFSG